MDQCFVGGDESALRRSRWLPGIGVLEPPNCAHPCAGLTCAVLAPDIPEPLHPTSSADIVRRPAFLADLHKSLLFAGKPPMLGQALLQSVDFS